MYSVSSTATGAKYVLTFTNSNYIKKYYLSTFTDGITDVLRGYRAFPISLLNKRS